jgi:hypothetical protein
MTWSEWPRRSKHDGSQATRPPGATALLLAISLTAGWAPAARAASCEIPAASAQAAAQATPEASAGIIEVEGAATPASLPIATPVANAVPALDPQVMLTDELLAVSQSLAACLSEGDAETTAELAGDRYLGQLFGSSVPLPAEDYVDIAAELTPIPTRIVTLADVAQPDGESATAIVTQVVGNQLMRAEWTFARAPRGERRSGQSDWKLASERQLPVEAPRNAASIEVEIGELSFTLNPVTVTGPDVVLRGNNVAAVDHEMLVLTFGNGATTDDLLRASGPDLPENVTFVGEIPVRAGHETDLVLTDLDPGVYTIVCLFPNADGVPFLSEGMEASFTVE